MECCKIITGNPNLASGYDGNGNIIELINVAGESGVYFIETIGEDLGLGGDIPLTDPFGGDHASYTYICIAEIVLFCIFDKMILKCDEALVWRLI